MRLGAYLLALAYVRYAITTPAATADSGGWRFALRLGA
jgi:hypothetical protein